MEAKLTEVLWHKICFEAVSYAVVTASFGISRNSKRETSVSEHECAHDCDRGKSTGIEKNVDEARRRFPRDAALVNGGQFLSVRLG